MKNLIKEEVLGNTSNSKLVMCFGVNCRDNNPKSVNKSFDELIELFGEPDLKRGKLTLDAYLELDKDDKAQKGKRSRE